MIQSLQRLRESLPLSCKCAIGILIVSPFILFFGKLQAGDAVSTWLSFWPGIAFGGVPLGFDSRLTGRTFPFSDS